MTYVVTWTWIGESNVTRAELFESLWDADTFYGALLSDPTATCVKLIKGEII